ncbi:MAG: GNAT family N-acetyltransferase [Pseudomonadota bacterium]
MIGLTPDSDILAAAPLIETERLALQSFGRRHLTANYVGWLNDPETMRFSENRHRRHTSESALAYIAGIANSPSLLWTIEAKDLANMHIGNISATIDPQNRVADIGILIGEKEASNRGYGAEAWRAVLRYLADRSDIDKVTGGCLESHVAMQRIMQKSGMQCDGRRRRHYVFEGNRTDLVYMAHYADDGPS